MSTALQLRDADTMGDWQVIREQASMLIKSGFLPQSIKSPEQALAIILTGRELGIGTMQALNNINVIQGKPTVAPQLMLALVNRSGQVEDLKIEASREGATCTIKRRGRSAYTARFGPAEAAAMGLNGKDNYKKQPGTMYKWRAVADACRAVFPDVILGLYLPDEMGAAVEVETGEAIEMMPAHMSEAAEELQAHLEISDEVIQGEFKTAGELLRISDRGISEPVRPVKLEGVQSTDSKPTQATDATTRSIQALLAFLKWDANTLANDIYTRFQVGVSDTDISLALEALSGAQKKVLLQALEGERKARSGVR